MATASPGCGPSDGWKVRDHWRRHTGGDTRPAHALVRSTVCRVRVLRGCAAIRLCQCTAWFRPCFSSRQRHDRMTVLLAVLLCPGRCIVTNQCRQVGAPGAWPAEDALPAPASWPSSRRGCDRSIVATRPAGPVDGRPGRGEGLSQERTGSGPARRAARAPASRAYGGPGGARRGCRPRPASSRTIHGTAMVAGRHRRPGYCLTNTMSPLAGIVTASRPSCDGMDAPAFPTFAPP